jgi:spermidine synthase
MLVALIYFVVWGRTRDVIAPLATALVLGVGVGALGVYVTHGKHRADREGFDEKFYGNSNFGVLQVIDIGATRYYFNDYLTQNTYDPVQKQSMALFTYMLHGLGRVYTTNASDVLCIGLGIGIVPMQFAREGARVDVVEINPAVVPVAEEFFDFNKAKVNLTLGDGRPFLNRCTNKYDVVALDAFLGESSPSHLMSREAFQQMRRVLKPGGVLTINAFASFDPGEDFLGASLYRTLTNVFPHVRIHSAGGGNTFYVASDHSLASFRREPDLSGVHPSKVDEVERAYAGVIEPEEANGRFTFTLHPNNGRVLTDDFNPVEFFDVKNRERIRRNLALGMREVER